MARRCSICGKGPQVGHRVSHSARKTKHRWLPNLQKVRIITPDGQRRRVVVCTKCIKAGKIAKR